MKHEFYDIACYIEPQQYSKLQEMMSAGMKSPFANRTPQVSGQTAVIPVMGIIESEHNCNSFSAEYFAAASEIVPAIERAAADPNVKDIVLFFDTPGGSCKACDAISYAVQQAAIAKNVESFVDGMLCSAGVHIAAFSRKITATPNSIIGSVGVISTYYDYSSLFNKLGIEAKVLTTGVMKAMGVLGAEITDEQINSRMELINTLADEFKQVLITQRKLTEQQVARIADKGDVWLARKALSLGLIDEIDRWDTFVSSRTATSAAVSMPVKKQERGNHMDAKEKKAAILASCKGINETKYAAFILSALMSDKEISEIAADWREQKHEQEKAELRAELEAMKKERAKEAAVFQGKKSVGAEPVATNQKEQPTGDIQYQYRQAIQKIQEQGYARGEQMTKMQAADYLVQTNPQLAQSYYEYCINSPKETDGLEAVQALRI